MEKRHKTLTIWFAATVVGGVTLLLTMRGIDPHFSEIQMAARAGGPTLSDLKVAAASMILDDPVLEQKNVGLAMFGRRIFFDPRFSANQHISCATCHVPEKFFTDGLRVGTGISATTRNTPTVVNSFAQYWFFWDGRADSLASQALKPIEDEREHGFDRVGVVRLIVEHYRTEYEALFGNLPDSMLATLPQAAKPMAAVPTFSRSLLQVAASSVTDARLLKQIGAATDSVAGVKELLGIGDPKEQALRQAVSFEQMPPEGQELVNRIFADVGYALAVWQETLVANESPFDLFARSWTAASEDSAAEAHFNEGFGSEELLGLQIFVGKGGCNLCHTGPALSDQQFHNIALPQQGDLLELGRSHGVAVVTEDSFNCRSHVWDQRLLDSESCKDLPFLDKDTPEAIGAFKTPSLRSVALTAPYMHDGRFQTLAEVIDHYDRMDTMPAVGYREETLRPLGLSYQEKSALHAFLRSLTSPFREVEVNE